MKFTKVNTVLSSNQAAPPSYHFFCEICGKAAVVGREIEFPFLFFFHFLVVLLSKCTLYNKAKLFMEFQDSNLDPIN